MLGGQSRFRGEVQSYALPPQPPIVYETIKCGSISAAGCWRFLHRRPPAVIAGASRCDNIGPEMVLSSARVEKASEAKKAWEARRSYRAYVEYVRGWKIPLHQDEWVTAIDELLKGSLLDGEGKPTHKLMILAPPGSGKTALVVEAMEFLIGREVSMGRLPQIGLITHSDSLAWQRSVAVRETLEENERYVEVVFPEVRPDKSKGWGKEELYVKHPRGVTGTVGPALFAAGLTGGHRGHRYPTAVFIDDIHGERNISTDTSKDEVWRVYSSTIKTRAIGGKTPIMLIATRLAEDDVPGRIMELESGWRIIHTPAIDSDGRIYWPYFEDEDGSPYGLKEEEAERLQAEEPMTWLTQYMAMPPSSRGEIFLGDWLKKERGPRPKSEDVIGVYQSWDTAYGDRKMNTYNAMVEGVLTKERNLYLSFAWQKKMETTDLLEAVVEQQTRGYEEWEMLPHVLVENKASGTAVVNLLQRRIRRIRAINIPNASLQERARASAVADWFKKGRVYLDNDWQGWHEMYTAQLTAFPHTKYKDLVAATVLLIEEVLGKRHKMPDVQFKYGRW